MDFQYLLDIVLRRKWLVVLAGLIPAIATFVYISLQDRSYKSAAIISTRLIGTGLNLEDDTRGYVQDVMIGIDFSTRLEKMKGPSMKRLLAYQMLLHDLSGEEEPFRTIEKPEELKTIRGERKITQNDIAELLTTIKPRLDTLNTLPLTIEQEEIFKTVCEELDYNFKAFDEEVIAYRRGETDFIAAEYESEDPFLSAYLVNQLAEIYLRLNRFEQDKDYVDANKFAQRVAGEKRIALNVAKDQLNLYRESRTVVDLETQSQGVVERIQELEEELEKERSTLVIADKTITEIIDIKNRNITNQKNRDYSELIDNEEVVRLRSDLDEFNKLYIETKDEDYLTKAKLLQRQLDIYVERGVKRQVEETENTSVDINKSLEELLIEWRLEQNRAQESFNSYQTQLKLLTQRRDGLVTDYAQVNRLESDLELAKEEYEDAKLRANETQRKLDKSYHPLQIVEYGQVAEKHESSGRVLFTLFSGVLGGGFCTVTLLLLAFFDSSLNNPHQFNKFTHMNLVGTINEIEGSGVDLNDIFSSNGKNESLLSFKESIRNIRYVMEESGGSTFLFTSTEDQAGKTFLMITLAYAMTLKQKKVLLIDTNFKNNTLTQMSEKAQRKNLLTTKLIGKNKLEDDFESKMGKVSGFSVDHVDIIGNRGGYNSPGEIFAGKDFKQFINDLSQSYDYVFLEGPSLNQFADTKELIEFADKVITVFSAESIISDSDKKSIKFLKQLDDKLLGAILNKLDLANLN